MGNIFLHLFDTLTVEHIFSLLNQQRIFPLTSQPVQGLFRDKLFPFHSPTAAVERSSFQRSVGQPSQRGKTPICPSAGRTIYLTVLAPPIRRSDRTFLFLFTSKYWHLLIIVIIQYMHFPLWNRTQAEKKRSGRHFSFSPCSSTSSGSSCPEDNQELGR